MGSVYLPKGRTNYMIKYVRDGVWIPEATGTSDEKEARKILRDRETDIGRGIPLAKGVGKIRFAAAAENIVADYRLNNRSNISNLITLIDKHLRPVFGNCRMSTITADDVRSFADDKLSDDYAPAAINNMLSALKRMFSLCIESGTLLYKPYILKLEADNVREGFFERDEFVAVHARLPQWLRDPVELAYYTGWRMQSEVMPFQWGRHIDIDGAVLKLNPGEAKNKQGRTFPYDVLPPLAQLIARLQKEAKARQKKTNEIVPWVFHREGEPLIIKCGTMHEDCRLEWAAATKAAGCPDRLFHDFRRTAVRNLVRSGVPEKVAMQLTGHKTRSVFDRYDIVNEDDLRTGVERYAAGPRAIGKPRGKVIGIGRARQ